MNLIRENSWNEKFFLRFMEFRNKIHAGIITSFPETLEDYARFFAPHSPFADDYKWEAFLVVENENVLAKGILCWRNDGITGNLGFVDWENNVEAAILLVSSAADTASKNNLKNIKTPVDFNLYIKYRIKLPGGGEPFWGEPVYPDYYHDLFKASGLQEIGRWDTYRLHKIQGTIDYFLKRKKLSTKPVGSHNKAKDKKLRTTIRCIKMNDWDNEIKIIQNLFNEAYRSMPEWEPITFNQFKLIYDDFKYIINPYYSYIVELRGKPVGFSINFIDPLNILLKVKGKKLSKIQKAILFIKLRANIGTFMIAHVGKIPGPDGEEIKGVQIQVSKRIALAAAIMPKVLVTFQMKNSPSRRSFEEKSQDAYSQYVLYGKSLE